jgi:hypothetical protein
VSSLAEALQILLKAIEGERSALVALDGVALVQAGEAKLAALDRISACLRDTPPGDEAESALRKAYELHQANADLLLRRRQETSWLLKMLGAVDPAAAYDASGDRRDAAITRHIAEA